MDNLELFKFIGIQNEEDANKAMEVFCQEYSAITGTPPENVWDVLSLPEDIEEAVVIKDSPLISERSINIITVLKNLVKKWFSKEELPVAKRISRMISDNQTDILPVGDFVRIAAHVYGNREDAILANQWQCLGNEYNGIRLDDPKSGLQAMLYKLDEGKISRYVYAIAGTQNAKDWLTNLGQVIGISDQHDRAAEAAEKLAKELGTENLKMVGHSKGGGQAAYCAMRTGCNAITFNPAGLGLYRYNLENWIEPRIDSFVMTTDPLNIFQLAAQLIAFDISADGSVHYVRPTKDMPLDIENTHGMNAFLHILSTLLTNDDD